MENKQLSFVSLNIEGGQHLDKVRGFVSERNPDIICFQECLESKFEFFKKDFGMDGVYAPMVRLPKDYKRDAGEMTGLAIFSRLPIKSQPFEIYWTGRNPILEKNGVILTHSEEENHGVLKTAVSSGGKEYHIFATHFVWTPDGEADERQRRAFANLSKILEKEPSFILCGDFNAPRGKEIFSKIAEKYKDNIPPEYDSSLDPNLHRAKGLKYMVDGLFSTPDYKVENVKLVCGISDHCAVTARISKA